MKHHFHVIGLPHTWTSKVHCACAYTMKVFNFCKMMHERGHTVTHYGAQFSDPPCSENVQIISRQEQLDYFGEWDKQATYASQPDFWSTDTKYWRTFNANAITAILRRCLPGDILACITWTQNPIAAWLPELHAVEYGIGYGKTFAKFKVFESYAHHALIRGNETRDPDGNPYDVVIPNYYDVSDYPMGTERKDYFLYVGRLIERKGLGTAVEVARHVGKRLIIAGQGAQSWEPGKLVTKDGHTYTGEHLLYVGHVDVRYRAELMGGALATLVPTIYLGPFEGVAVESMLCGTPVLTTDWGAFPETVEHGVTGWRCRTAEQWLWAANNVDKLAPSGIIRDRAVSRYSLERVGAMFEEYFQMVHESGSQVGAPRTNLDWLEEGYHAS